MRGQILPIFMNNGPFVTAHTGWTTLVGLCVSLSWDFRRALFAWALGAITLTVATLNRISINYRGKAGPCVRGLISDGPYQHRC
ncbi:MAG: hypothetical protein ACJAQ9_002806 [Ilumatobacter sp.]|jgi:hypothetical protein